MRRIQLAAVLSVSLLAVACGSSSKSRSTTTGSSAPQANTRAGYIAAADALCKSANARQDALQRRAKGIVVAKLPPILREQAGIAATLSTDLGKLTPPVGDAVAVGRFVKAVNLLAVYSKAVANSIAAQHSYAAGVLANKLTLARQQEKFLGEGYGFKVCASGRSY